MDPTRDENRDSPPGEHSVTDSSGVDRPHTRSRGPVGGAGSVADGAASAAAAAAQGSGSALEESSVSDLLQQIIGDFSLELRALRREREELREQYGKEKEDFERQIQELRQLVASSAGGVPGGSVDGGAVSEHVEHDAVGGTPGNPPPPPPSGGGDPDSGAGPSGMTPSRVSGSSSGYATFRPEPPMTFTGKSEALKDWIVAVEEYMMLYGLDDEHRKFIIVKQFLAPGVKRWVQNLDGVSTWYGLREEMEKYYKDDLERHRAWSALARLKQTGSAKDYTDRFLQTIVLLGKMDEEQMIERYVSGLKDNLQDDVALGRIKGDLKTFTEIKQYAEVLDNMRWKNRKASSGPTKAVFSSGTSGGNSSDKPQTDSSGKKPKKSYAYGLNAIMDSHQLSDEQKAKCLKERLCFICSKSGHLAKDCPEKKPKN
jgi:Retrotransposon gag protein/Zinc knuckle